MTGSGRRFCNVEKVGKLNELRTSAADVPVARTFSEHSCCGTDPVAITSYRDLDAWQVSMVLVEQIYKLSAEFPRTEAYGLTLQLRRAAVGIPSNVSEGHQRGTRTYRHYVSIALGCQAECETQLELARRLGFAAPDRMLPVIDTTQRVGQILHGLLRSLPRD